MLARHGRHGRTIAGAKPRAGENVLHAQDDLLGRNTLATPRGDQLARRGLPAATSELRFAATVTNLLRLHTHLTTTTT